MIVLYFTATGNNLYVAKRIGGKYYSIPKLIKENKYDFEDDKIGIVFPTYNLGVPKIVEEFLNKAKLKSKYIFAVTSYGAFSGGTAKHVLDIGERNGIQFSYVNEILMIDNYIPVFDIDKEREKEPKKKIEQNLEKIVKDIEDGKQYIKKHAPIRKLIEKLIVIYNSKNQESLEKNFYVEGECNKCKICEKVCPVDNIEVGIQPYFNNNCQNCLACINHCPQNIIRFLGEKSEARFINQNVKLKEIIEANN